MSPNVNYRAGRDFEYKRRKHWQREGYEVIRAAGSHGCFDLIAFRTDAPVLGIQCKRVDKRSHANRMLKAFSSAPPLQPSFHFHQVMEVYVKEDREILSTTI